MNKTTNFNYEEIYKHCTLSTYTGFSMSNTTAVEFFISGGDQILQKIAISYRYRLEFYSQCWAFSQPEIYIQLPAWIENPDATDELSLPEVWPSVLSGQLAYL